MALLDLLYGGNRLRLDQLDPSQFGPEIGMLDPITLARMKQLAGGRPGSEGSPLMRFPGDPQPRGSYTQSPYIDPSYAPGGPPGEPIPGPALPPSVMPSTATALPMRRDQIFPSTTMPPGRPSPAFTTPPIDETSVATSETPTPRYQRGAQFPTVASTGGPVDATRPVSLPSLPLLPPTVPFPPGAVPEAGAGESQFATGPQPTPDQWGFGPGLLNALTPVRTSTVGPDVSTQDPAWSGPPVVGNAPLTRAPDLPERTIPSSNPTPTTPPPPTPASASVNPWDRFGDFLSKNSNLFLGLSQMAGGRSIGEGIALAGQGVMSGAQLDRANQMIAMTKQMLLSKGYSEEEANALANNPSVMGGVVKNLFPQWEYKPIGGTDIAGNPLHGWVKQPSSRPSQGAREMGPDGKWRVWHNGQWHKETL